MWVMVEISKYIHRYPVIEVTEFQSFSLDEQKQNVRLSCACSSTGASAFQAMQYLPHQQPGYPVHSHFTSQPGQFLFIIVLELPLMMFSVY